MVVRLLFLASLSGTGTAPRYLQDERIMMERTVGQMVGMAYVMGATTSRQAVADQGGVSAERQRVTEGLAAVCRSIASGEEGAGVVAYVRLEHLDLLRETYGEACAERMVGQVAGVIGACVRPGDFFGRISRNEMLVVFPNCQKGLARSSMVRSHDAFIRSHEDQESSPFTFSVFELDPGFNLNVFLQFVRNEPIAAGPISD